MQNIDLICVGKLNAKYFAEGVADVRSGWRRLHRSASSSCRKRRSKRKTLPTLW